MKSYRTGVKPHRRAAARLVADTRRAIQIAYAEQRRGGLNQSRIADILDVDKSVISRQMRGTADMSVGRIGEIACLLGRRAKITLEKIEVAPGSNERGQGEVVKLDRQPKTTVTNSKSLSPSSFVVTREDEPA